MCGRYTLFTPPEDLQERFGAEPTRPLEARYNCAPSQELPVVTNEAPDEFRFLKWGLVPSWADSAKVGNDRINARGETVRQKRSFADAYESRRCLVPADGFYEWVDRGGSKQPYRVAFEDDRPFAMAGLWERWTPQTKQTGLGDFGSGDPSREQEPLETFTIVTTEPNDLISELHNRMAVVLAPDEEETWLHGDPDEAASLLDPYPDDELTAYPVSTRVNSPANDGPRLIEQVEV
ncbi:MULTISPECIES: SOS response-associated peptidase [Haloferax]|uniref:SOS response-associated peptidase n=2 Tax=Haloferax TaxID=2251 RepID=A0A6G1Z3Q2_9EURY|nr:MULTISPECIES: SOS response-associated peptidase [Haloferax]KAB1188352.1 SOS response-associated peptidase [Haloferax sp. CBA1149]MRW81041.1 SOS response-associated peptidase [Haloferax marinisediminis]